MTSLQIFQIDAFAEKRFMGNPAAVVPLAAWLKAKQMQEIAAENNLSETAFVVKSGLGRYEIRWFTPSVEVNLCGHATLASAYALWEELGEKSNPIYFESKSGELSVEKEGDVLWLNFPADMPKNVNENTDWNMIMGLQPKEVLRGKEDILLVYESEDAINFLKPDFDAIAEIDARGIIVSSVGNNVDFVSRFFCPAVGIKEDPATGSTHTVLIPYWADRLNKRKLNALQLSERKGQFFCEDLGHRVRIGGQAKLYMRGNIYLS